MNYFVGFRRTKFYFDENIKSACVKVTLWPLLKY